MAFISPEAELEEIRRLGEIRDTPPLPADYDPFKGDEPYKVSPDLFTEGAEIAEALANEGEVGDVVWDFTGE